MTIGKVAKLAGVTADTIRYYERLALLPRAARTPAGYRQYSQNVVRRVALIKSAQRFGFSLRQIASFLRTRDRGGKPCHDVRAAAQQLLDAFDRQIEALTSTREHVRQTLEGWDRTLARTSAAEPARLLEGLIDGPDGTDPGATKARGAAAVHSQSRKRS
jgi:DNA-binding transcriptional MerR regulator